MHKTCKNCKYYYKIMATGAGYNPFTCCHRYEDEGKPAQPLTLECWKKRTKNNKKEIAKNAL